MVDLYLATRSDAPHLLNIGRSSNTGDRCRQLQTGHCFRVQVLAIFRGMGNCERPVHRALREYRIDGSEWFVIDMLSAVEAIQEATPSTPRKGIYDLERIARRNKQKGKTLRSTRYPHLNESPHRYA